MLYNTLGAFCRFWALRFFVSPKMKSPPFLPFLHSQVQNIYHLRSLICYIPFWAVYLRSGRCLGGAVYFVDLRQNTAHGENYIKSIGLCVCYAIALYYILYLYYIGISVLYYDCVMFCRLGRKLQKKTKKILKKCVKTIDKLRRLW